MEMNNQNLADGVYDLLYVEYLEKIIQSAANLEIRDEKIEDSDVERAVLNHLIPILHRFIGDQNNAAEKIDVANQLLKFMNGEDFKITQQKRMTGLINDTHSGTSKISKVPKIPLSEMALLTNLVNEPKIGNEIKSEIASADAIDVVMSFVMKGGVNFLENELIDYVNRGGKMRLITTTYMGNSNADAILRMARDFNAEVRVSLDIENDRLHAKSWIFHRDTGFSTAYVGSSNLSFGALNNGNEWNVKISKRSSSELFAKVQASFESLWNREGLMRFDPTTDREKLEIALKQAKGNSAEFAQSKIYDLIDVVPKKHQEDMLEALAKEREVFGRHWNLIVSATGTGKTMLAALDYRRLIQPGSPKPRILFVAHKQEILDQAVRTFRIVLKDQSFGELFFSGKKPTEWKHVFATIQSLSLKDLTDLNPDHFDYVVVDEFHHAEAATYKKFLDYIEPKELLALTATPERTDLVNIQDSYFQGRIAAELRLWDAITEELLVPFHYYGVADGTDLTQITWNKGKYSNVDLDNLLTANDARNAIIYNSIIKYLDSAEDIRGLAFCVSKAHAKSMSAFLNSKGIKSADVTSDTGEEERKLAITQLANGDLNVICAVDIFNEGVDIPVVNTVLFLRPTESPLIFLQQLGRGLRTHPGKSHLTVLDFVGLHRTEYKFVRKLQALTNLGKNAIQQNLENDFPFLPSGCQIIFDKKSKEIVLNNLQSQIKSKFKELIEELKICSDVSLLEFLKSSGFEISDVYASSKSWTFARHAAGFIKEVPSKIELEIARRISNFYYASDPERNSHYSDLMFGNIAPFDDQTERQKYLTSMFFWNLFPSGQIENVIKFQTYDDGVRYIRDNALLRKELRDVLEVAKDSCSFLPKPLGGNLASLPLSSHASYSRPELLAAFGYAQLAGQKVGPFSAKQTRSVSAHVSGVYFAEELGTDLLFVTLDKSGSFFSQKTAYKDYAISKQLFHWETQNSAAPSTPTGSRYINHKQLASHLVLTVRPKTRNELGTAPFQLLGNCDVESYSGERPMQMMLKVERDIPSDVIACSPVYDAG